MPDVAELGVKISANVNSLTQGIDQAAASMDKGAVAAEKLAAGVTDANTALTKTGGATSGITKGLANTAAAALKTDSSLGKLKAGTNEATQAMTNLGRIVQDAPFGFLGISNNLNPLLESFQRLKTATGSSGGALKALASSFIGAGGVGFAISLVSSALVLFGDKLFGTTKQTELAKIAVNGYAQSMQKAFEAAGKQVSQVSLIVAALEAENTSLAQRKKLLEDLNGINSTYFGGLKLERGEVEGLADAYQRYADNIFKVAKAKAAQDEINKLATSLVGITDQINTLTNTLAGNQRALTFKDAAGGIDTIKKNFEAVNKILLQNNITLEDFKLLSKVTGLNELDLNNILLKRQKLRTSEAQTLARIADLSKLVAKNDLGSIIGFVKPEPDKIEKAIRTAFGTGQIAAIPVTIPLQVEADLKDKGSITINPDSIDRQQLIRDFEQALGNLHIKLPKDFLGFSNVQLIKDTKNAIEILQDFNDDVSNILQNLQNQLIEGFAEGIGKAFAGENIGGLFGNMFAILGEGLKQLGKVMIEVSGIIKGIKIALSSLNPVLAAAAGFALIALGSYIESKAPRLAAGGIVPSGYPNDSFPAFLQSGEAVIPLDRLSQFVKQGGDFPDYLPAQALRGETLYLWYQRAAKSFNRNT